MQKDKKDVVLLIGRDVLGRRGRLSAFAALGMACMHVCVTLAVAYGGGIRRWHMAVA